jgi:hypothetical protein
MVKKFRTFTSYNTILTSMEEGGKKIDTPWKKRALDIIKTVAIQDPFFR